MTRFGYEQELATGLRHEMQLSPQALLSIEMLELPSTELEGFLSQAAQENEALRVEAPSRAERAAPPRALSGPRGGSADVFEGEAPPRGRVALLEEQLGVLDLDPLLAAWARLVIECLDTQGYLSLPDADILRLARELELDGGTDLLGRAIAVVQHLEPRGVGARDAIEALLLQIDPGEPDYPLLCRLLEEFLEEIARNKLPRVARALGIDLSRLAGLIERLRELRVAPGAELEERAAPRVRPELRVLVGERGIEVRLEPSELPSVTIDPEVERLAEDRRLDPEIRRGLRSKVGEARSIVEAVGRRSQTLLAIARWVFRRQRVFLERGPASLRPLRMTAAAEALGLSVSTVSRAVAGKHADTPFGILPLRDFFPSPAGGSELFARESLEESLRRAVAAEDRSRPLSDQELATHLAEQGYRVARRTVAKLREELGIPSSYRRRRYTP